MALEDANTPGREEHVVTGSERQLEEAPLVQLGDEGRATPAAASNSIRTEAPAGWTRRTRAASEEASGTERESSISCGRT